MHKSSVAVIVLNWNDADLIPKSVGSLLRQSEKCDIIVVDNGSKDNSKQVIRGFAEKITPLYNDNNLGFAGGVNTGIKHALKQGYKYIALLNNDAVAEKDWVKNLKEGFSGDKIGGVTCSLLHEDGKTYDSTGDIYTTWGLPYPRGRDEPVKGQYDEQTSVFAVSGGASMFRAEFFKDVGLFDEDFFAYYEDGDLGWRGQLAGWKFKFVPSAKVFHATGSTSSRVKNFTTYQALKNLPWLFWKNVPMSLMPTILPRFFVAYKLISLRALSRGQVLTVIKATLHYLVFMPKILYKRHLIQRNRKVSIKYLKSVLSYDLPPNANSLKKIRSTWWGLRGKS